MAETLTWTRDGARFTLAGRIDEQADLRRLAREIPEAGAVLDLGAIKRVNSIGTREWIAFTQTVKDRRIILERCPVPFVDQLNAIANFRGNCEVRTVIASFECPRCMEPRSAVVDIAATFPTREPGPLPPVGCPKCGDLLEFDDEPAQYFRFVKLLGR